LILEVSYVETQTTVIGQSIHSWLYKPSSGIALLWLALLL